MRHGETFEDVLQSQRRDAEAAARDPRRFRRQARRLAGRRRAEDHSAIPEEPRVRGASRTIARVSVYADDQLKATVAINDAGAYVAGLADAAATPRKAAKPTTSDSGGMSLYESLYETALKQGLPKPVIEISYALFANDVDFQRAVQPGDSIDRLLSPTPTTSTRAPELLYATMTVRDQTFRYYRFQTPDDNLRRLLRRERPLDAANSCCASRSPRAR